MRILPSTTVIFVLAAVFSASASATSGPYEPNDSVPSAAGPLTLNQTYTADIEVAGDTDYYFFHVTSSGETKVGLGLRNLGGGTYISDVDANVFNASMTPVASIPFVGQGEDRVIGFSLAPGKYFVEVVSREGYGDAYALTTSGGDGAFGDYGRIAGRCATASAAAKAFGEGLEQAKTKLQRAINRVRRSRYSNRIAREAAQLSYRKAKHAVNGRRDALSTAIAAQSPWCSIPP